MKARVVVLVEGISDQRAVATLAQRRGRDLEAEGVSILPIGGAHAIGTYLERFGPRGLDLKVAGLCDVGEEGTFRRALERAGLGNGLTRRDMEDLGFFVCVTDLEDELVRALGSSAVLRIVEAEGEARSVPDIPEAACKARAQPAGAAVALHVEQEDPVRAVTGRSARSRQRPPSAGRRPRPHLTPVLERSAHGELRNETRTP